MLLLLSGSSCSGKSTLAASCADLPGLAVHDSDEHGVPSDADLAWRQRDLEAWTRRAIALRADGRDLLLAGQSPWGEALAAPSADRLDGLALCLLDVADDERRRRLRARDPDRWDDAQEAAFVGWGRWHRAHAADPSAHSEVLTTGSWPAMRWSRWSGWTGDDPRWRTDVVDTTGQRREVSALEVRAWVGRARVERRQPLA